MPAFHPATIILLWVAFVVALARTTVDVLLILGLVATAAAVVLAPHGVWNTIRRARWLLFAAFVVFAFSMPGVAVFTQMPRWSPTWEGVQAGATQVFRLGVALATLAGILSWLSVEALLSAIFFLARPLRVFAIDPVRVAVRLSLVLRFAKEPATAGRNLHRMLNPVVEDSGEVVRLSLATPGWADALVLIAIWTGVLYL